MQRLCALVTLICALLFAVTAADSAHNDTMEPHSRVKRADVTCAPKFQVFSGHTACLSVIDTHGVSQEDKNVIVDTHNQYRANVNPTAANMRTMYWDEEVAMIAQKWADNCKIEHDSLRWVPGRYGVGQNLASGSTDWPSAIKLWYDEVSSFTYGDSSMNSAWRDIAHYTQVMWATTNRVGCGYNECGGKRFYVCDYAPAGNLVNHFHQPYEQDTSCAACPGHCDSTSKLCDCNGLTCLNGGTLDLATCTCSCLGGYPFYKQPDCSLDCPGNADPSDICKDSSNCPGYKNYCPNMCQICPYADDTYTAPPTAAAPSGPGPLDNGSPAVTCQIGGLPLVAGLFCLLLQLLLL